MPELPEGTNVLGVGTDLIEVDRIRSSIESHAERFIEKVFTSNEREYCEGMADPAPHFAARFAAKEAISKANAAREQMAPVRGERSPTVMSMTQPSVGWSGPAWPKPSSSGSSRIQ